MDNYLRILLILTGLTGIQSITTVSKVTVKVGDSITIPCLYDSRYVNHVKYLCKGFYWPSCSCAVKTNQPHHSGKFLISDDKSQRIFTVTIKDLTDEDTDYWCVVEIDGGGDVKKYFHLSVTKGTPSLYVHPQEITGLTGQQIIITGNYRNSGKLKWCRLGSSCVTDQFPSIDGTTVTINTSVPNVFTVTMNELRTESSGWYLCVSEDLQMPVHVTVNEQATTATLATRQLTTFSPTTEPVSFTPVFTDRAPTIAQGTQRSASVALKVLVIPLSLLIFIVMVALFIWCLIKKHKENKTVSSAMTAAEEDITYCNVEYVGKTPSQRPCTESDVHVVHSSMVTRRPSVQRVPVANDETVTYSTLA